MRSILLLALILFPLHLPAAVKGEAHANTKPLKLEGDLSAALRMKVRIDHKPGQEAGSVSISYDTLEQLDELCMLLSTSR